MQTDVGVERVRQWARENLQALNDDDIFISTNVDEVLRTELSDKEKPRF